MVKNAKTVFRYPTKDFSALFLANFATNFQIWALVTQTTRTSYRKHFKRLFYDQIVE